MKKLTYAPAGASDLTPEETAGETTLGKYGRMKEQYLKEHRPKAYYSLLTAGRLTEYLQEIDSMANSRLEALVPALAKEAGATEQMKAAEPSRWAWLMNACKNQAEELVLAGLIYN